MSTTAPAPRTAPRPAPPPPSRMKLAAVTRGIVLAPLRIVLYGVQGVGKTTCAAGAPAPIFLGEEGSNNLNVARFPPVERWQDVLDAVEELTVTDHDRKTLVIDKLSTLEPLCWAEVCREDNAANIEKVGGGFQKGYVVAVDKWRVFLAALERLRAAKGMHIILLDDAGVRNAKNPEGADYGRITLTLQEKAARLFIGWSDLVLFAEFETWIVEDKDKKKARGVSTQVRIVRTQRTAACDAKTRYNLAERLALDWQTIADAIAGVGALTPEDLKKAIEQRLGEVGDAELAAKVRASIEHFGDNAAELARIHNKLAALVGEGQGATS